MLFIKAGSKDLAFFLLTKKKQILRDFRMNLLFAESEIYARRIGIFRRIQERAVI